MAMNHPVFKLIRFVTSPLVRLLDFNIIFFHQSFGDDRRPLPELREIQSRYVFENVPKLDKF